MSSQPNILHISTPKSWRGGEQQLSYLHEELNTKDINQYILCRKGSEIAIRGKKKGWNIIECKKRTAIDPVFAKKVKSICDLRNIDIIHTHDSHAHSFAVLSAILYGNKTPIVVSRRVDFAIKQTLFSKLKYNHKNVKRILCVSNAIKTLTLPDIKNKNIVKTVHSGINTDRFPFQKRDSNKLRAEFNISNSVKIIGNIAAISPHKDYFTFVNTVKKLVSMRVNAKFIIIGTGPLEEEIKEYTSKQKMEEHIIFTGFRADIPEILPELDIFLITSETEGLGTSVIDAFACKVPVVGTQAGGIPELVKHEKSGLLAPVKDAEELAFQVNRILKNEIDLEAMIESQQEILKSFTKTATAEKTLKEYLSLIN